MGLIANFTGSDSGDNFGDTIDIIEFLDGSHNFVYMVSNVDETSTGKTDQAYYVEVIINP
jgi:hypothetical protein